MSNYCLKTFLKQDFNVIILTFMRVVTAQHLKT